MGSGLHKLSAAKVAKCATPGYLLDGGGLYLQVAPRASRRGDSAKSTPASLVTKSWCFRYRDRGTGRLREMGLGPFPDVSLEAARGKAAELRELLRAGRDPMAERAARRATLRADLAKEMTFDQAAAACISDRRAEWRSEKHAAQWSSTLATYVSPVIGKLPVSAIDLALVRKVLDPIWLTKNETASRVRQRIETVLAWATVSGFRKGENPARWRGHLDQLLPKPSKIQKAEHHPALPYDKIGAFVAELRQKASTSALALEFTILTAARTREVLEASWEEFDLERRIWVIPAARMKAGKAHTVPLSPRAMEILEAMGEVQEGSHVFLGGREGAPLSNMAMIALLKRMGRSDITVHGFRSTFRDWAGEQTTFPREVIEHALAHQLKDRAEAAYARSTLPEKRRKLMEAWAEYCAAE
ncbi:MAG: integrase arm-type DNA-binding domain-containing protein [Acidobacteria bacterium]|nr:integrase arm-type DNA-binding domain-containing protein [Acidobacteriota bacterium]